MVVPEEVDAPVCILGAGPHGLAMVLPLCTADPALAERLVVVDPSGTSVSDNASPLPLRACTNEVEVRKS